MKMEFYPPPLVSFFKNYFLFNISSNLSHNILRRAFLAAIFPSLSTTMIWGMDSIPNAFRMVDFSQPPSAKALNQGICSSSQAFFHLSSESSSEILTKRTPCPSSSLYNSRKLFISLRHGPHHDAQKSNTTTEPRNELIDTLFPSSSVTVKSGTSVPSIEVTRSSTCFFKAIPHWDSRTLAPNTSYNPFAYR